MNPCVSIKKADLGYKKGNHVTRILQDVSFEAAPGDFIGIAGLNGSGKSTLLKTICGMLPLLNGEILLAGSNIETLSRREMAKHISVVLTDKISGFNLTCFDAVAAGQIPYTNMFNQLEPAHLAVISDAIEKCGISEHSHKLLNELSDGLFQKTMIARSLAQQTRVMLLDEPSAYLDYASKHELFILLKNLAEKQGKCILLSSHDLDLLLKYCNKIALVKNSTLELVDAGAARWHSVFKELSGGFL